MAMTKVKGTRYKIYGADGKYWKTTRLQASPRSLRKSYPKARFVKSSSQKRKKSRKSRSTSIFPWV